MQTIEINGDMLTSDAQVLCHQVNCLGIMGGGIALQIRNKWPEVFAQYEMLCNDHTDNTEALLGKLQMCHTNDGHIIANIFGQNLCGSYKRQTNYEAQLKALSTLADFAKTGKYSTFAFPHLFGCGLAGGDWNVVRPIIEKAFHDTEAVIEFWHFNG